MNIQQLVRPNIRTLQAFKAARHEYDGKAEIFLDANENPYDTGYNRYPDPFQKDLKGALSAHYGIGVENVIAGNGSDEIIDWLIRGFCEPRKDEIRILAPSFGMYRALGSLNDVRIVEVMLDHTFDLQIGECLKGVDASTKLFFLCSPNNPTGNCLSREKMLQLAERFGGLVVVDEAYIDFADQKSMVGALDHHPNLVILRTFSKAYGAAGIRLGAALSSEEVISVLEKIKLPYNIGSFTQQKGQELVGQLDDISAYISDIRYERERLRKELPRFRSVQHVYPSEANFLLVRFADATSMYKALIQKGIIVRDRSNLPGCQNCLRITIGTEFENDRLLIELHALES